MKDLYVDHTLTLSPNLYFVSVLTRMLLCAMLYIRNGPQWLDRLLVPFFAIMACLFLLKYYRTREQSIWKPYLVPIITYFVIAILLAIDTAGLSPHVSSVVGPICAGLLLTQILIGIAVHHVFSII